MYVCNSPIYTSKIPISMGNMVVLLINVSPEHLTCTSPAKQKISFLGFKADDVL